MDKKQWYRVSMNLKTGAITHTEINTDEVDFRMSSLYFGSSTVFIFSKSPTRGKKRLTVNARHHYQKVIDDAQAIMDIIPI